MFDGFTRERVETSEAMINLVRGGAGEPLLLLHGYPQTHVMWHRVAPYLAEHFTVVATDLRGYGDSSKPPSTSDHSSYSKRVTARDQVEVMEALGYDDFAVCGHDRGARVAHRMVLDHPDRVRKLALLDIVPTYTIFRDVTKEFATVSYHWFFLIQPPDFPETLIGRDPSYFLRWTLSSWSASDAFAEEALAEYERCFADPEMIRGSCEDYRAGASIDLVHDAADLDRKVTCPVFVLWGAAGKMPKLYDVLETWRERAADVRGRGVQCGHFLPEELPEETANELLAFFRS